MFGYYQRLNRPRVGLLLGFLAASSVLVACAEFADEGATVAPWSLPDVFTDAGFAIDVDAGATDAQSGDQGPQDSEGSQDGQGGEVDTVGQPPLQKSDDSYLVPFTVAAKAHLAIGPAGAAWIERVPAAGGNPASLRLGLLATGPDLQAISSTVYFALPTAVDPRHIAVGEHWIVFSDIPYGDRDVFGIHIASGQKTTVAGQLYDQSRPSIRGGVVAWQDCRDCITGSALDDRPEIYQRSLGTVPADVGAEFRVTDDDIADRGPVWGTLDDGAPALAWVKAETNMRVKADGFDDTFDVGSVLDGIALTQGVLAFRPSPFILNPDSMMPVDVYLLDIATQTQTSVSVHSELWPTLPVPPVGDAGKVAWLESIPANGLEAQRIRVVDVGAPADPPITLTADNVGGIALFGGWLGFVAPRDDNGGDDDVWLYKL